MVNHASVLGYFWQAGMIVKSVMLILLIASIISWTLIIQRAWFFNRKKQEYDEFNDRFWASTDLTKLYADIDSNVEEKEGLASIFHAGFKEFIRVSQKLHVERACPVASWFGRVPNRF